MSDDKLPAPPNADSGELDIPDLCPGLVIGIQPEGGLYIYQIATPLHPPIVDLLATKGMLELSLLRVEQMIQEVTRTGPSAHAAETRGFLESLAQSVRLLATDMTAFRELIARSQQANADLLQFVHGQVTNPRPEKKPKKKSKKAVAEKDTNKKEQPKS